jgi:hypothetical protein
MTKDGVATAFELIIEEIEVVATEIAELGGKAFRDKAHNAAQELIESSKTLEDFRSKVTALLEEWQSGIDITTRQRFAERRTKPTKPYRQHTKAPKTRLRAHFADGTKIEEYYAADTFALAIRHFGLSRVESLGFTENGLPLVGNVRSDKYGQRRVDGKYICTHSGTQTKKKHLNRIAKKLGVSLKVDII